MKRTGQLINSNTFPREAQSGQFIVGACLWEPRSMILNLWNQCNREIRISNPMMISMNLPLICPFYQVSLQLWEDSFSRSGLLVSVAVLLDSHYLLECGCNKSAQIKVVLCEYEGTPYLERMNNPLVIIRVKTTKRLKGHIHSMSHWECNELRSRGALEDTFPRFVSC